MGTFSLSALPVVIHQYLRWSGRVAHCGLRVASGLPRRSLAGPQVRTGAKGNQGEKHCSSHLHRFTWGHMCPKCVRSTRKRALNVWRHFAQCIMPSGWDLLLARPSGGCFQDCSNSFQVLIQCWIVFFFPPLTLNSLNIYLGSLLGRSLLGRRDWRWICALKNGRHIGHLSRTTPCWWSCRLRSPLVFFGPGKCWKFMTPTDASEMGKIFWRKPSGSGETWP